jgi:phage baseplate assembly protein W
MATAAELFGTDLRLLGNLERQNDRAPGNDLFVAPRPVASGDGIVRVDLERVAGVENLQQALLLRFLTRRGELAILGHPDYGSRLHELIGELNDETRRTKAKLYTLEALAGEPRVQDVLAVTATQNRSDRTQVDVAVKLRVIGSPTPLDLVFAVNAAGPVAP